MLERLSRACLTNALPQEDIKINLAGPSGFIGFALLARVLICVDWLGFSVQNVRAPKQGVLDMRCPRKILQ